MPVNEEQEKLLQSALRIKIIQTLTGEPLTSKQVAERLGKTPGNVHYHIQKLYDGGLLELVRTEAAGGIMQKFYKSKSAWFRSADFSGFRFPPEDLVERFTTRLTLSDTELQAFRRDLMDLITSWEAKATQGREYGIEMAIGRLPEPEDNESNKEAQS
ncbi:helix-turn-helix domain-containing protein [Paenibacillus sp. HN-1]|nr:helix-turn-helix domain-containing protein [Paenibacillus sp. CGMCC 1.18879]MBY9086563.1 helix-turn-helix domain-containing protein [Paenibacillus sinensis]